MQIANIPHHIVTPNLSVLPVSLKHIAQLIINVLLLIARLLLLLIMIVLVMLNVQSQIHIVIPQAKNALNVTMISIAPMEDLVLKESVKIYSLNVVLPAQLDKYAAIKLALVSSQILQM